MDLERCIESQFILLACVFQVVPLNTILFVPYHDLYSSSTPHSAVVVPVSVRCVLYDARSCIRTDAATRNTCKSVQGAPVFVQSVASRKAQQSSGQAQTGVLCSQAGATCHTWAYLGDAVYTELN